MPVTHSALARPNDDIDTNVILVSSVFSQIKIAEPMGASLLAAALRAEGIGVDIMEPSLEGWSPYETALRVSERRPKLVGVSVLRDKNVDDVRTFVGHLREMLPTSFIVLGGHGPSIALAALPDGMPVASHLDAGGVAQEPVVAGHTSSEDPGPSLSRPYGSKNSVLVDAAVTDRGKGPGELGQLVQEPRLLPLVGDACSTSTSQQAKTDRASTTSDQATDTKDVSSPSPYYDKSSDYVAILNDADAYLLGEADQTFPRLVSAVLEGREWRDVNGLTWVDKEQQTLRKTPLPPKIADLDGLPYMARDVFQSYQGKYDERVPASILASRGCFYRCTFCSVVQYELLQEGSKHRQRSVDDIVGEMKHLHDEYGVTSFNFEDDNFIVKNKRGRDRLHEFADRLITLDAPLEFSFFCRADAVDEALFEHLTRAGLTGLYFGMESVHPGDLEFFHKGTRVDDNYRALDILHKLGFSVRVGAEKRIMLGYITWHPKTSIEGLRATSDFIRSYAAPPKLLRRKLRLYAGTEVLTDVERMGLLRPDHPDGWVFADPVMEGLDRYINTFFAHVNRVRDQLRTVEKASDQFPESSDLEALAHRANELRLWADGQLYDFFDAALDVAEKARTVSDRDSGLNDLLESSKQDVDAHFDENETTTIIRRAFGIVGLDVEAVDPYRK